MSDVLRGVEWGDRSDYSRVHPGRLPFEGRAVTPALYSGVILPRIGTPIILALRYPEDKPMKELV